MSRSAQAIKMIRQVGSTPGFAMEPQEKGRYKLLRFADAEHGVDEASITASGNASDQQHKNDLTRLKNKLGWTGELFDEMEEITRRHRIAGTDPTEDQRKARLLAWGIDPDAEPEEPEEHQPQRRRHGGGGSATGSAKVRAGVAESAGPSTEAAVQILQNVGRMQAELISPERAVDLLDRMATYQRKLDKRKVRDYAAAMTRGEWRLNPADPLCIDTNDMTANGMHRLHACVEAWVSFQCWVAYETPPDTYTVMDRGKKRSTADDLHSAGEVNTTFLASAARFAYLWFNVEQENWRTAPTVTDAQVYAMLESHPGLRESVKHGRLTKLKMSPQATMVAHYLIARKMGGDGELVAAWYKAMQLMDLRRGEPGHTLGLYYRDSGSRRRMPLKGRPRRDLDMYLLMQAWNNTCLGKTVKSISYDASSFTIPDPIVPRDGVHTFPPIT